MTEGTTPLLVSPDWIADHSGSVRILDGSWHIPSAARDSRAEFLETHIPGAAFFDIDGICDPETALPHMLPSAELFAAGAGALGIDNDSHIVVYDTVGLYSAPRVWWMFRVFGHERVSLLAGGLPRWRAEGHPVESGAVRPRPASFRAVRDGSLVRSFDQVRAHLAAGDAQLVDARAAARYGGSDPEPRPGVASGHIPGSRNLPFAGILREGGELEEAPVIRRAFLEAGVDPERPVVTTCGSGITACILALGLAAIEAPDVAVYDGSWSDWGSRKDAPVETGHPA